MGVLFSLIGLLFPLQLMYFFMDVNPEVIAAAPEIVRVYFLSFIFMGVCIWATSYFQAIMMTRLPTFLITLRGIVLSSLLYLLPLWLGLSGVWWAMVLTEALTAVLTIACVLWSNKVPTPED